MRQASLWRSFRFPKQDRQRVAVVPGRYRRRWSSINFFSRAEEIGDATDDLLIFLHLCSLRTDDLDPAHRTLRVRAETTKARWGRVVPYSVATGVLLPGYLAHRAGISRARGPLFLSESRRNHGEPLSLWTWSKVMRRVALAADVPQFSTHTTRHLCLTDLARMGWELHDRHLRRGPIDRVDADLHSPVGPRSCGEAVPFDVAPACAAHRHAHRCRRRRDGYHPVRSATPWWPRAEPYRCVAESSSDIADGRQ